MMHRHRLRLVLALVPSAALVIACQPGASPSPISPGDGSTSTPASMNASPSASGSPVAPADESDAPGAESPVATLSPEPNDGPYVAPDMATDAPGAEDPLPTPGS
jgi:hypothetical protein